MSYSTHKHQDNQVDEQHKSSGASHHASHVDDAHTKPKIPSLLTCIFLVLSIVCTASSIAVVYFAHGKLVGSWISRLPAVDPLEMFVAGVSIKWWRTYQSGTNLASLHYISNQGKGEGILGTVRAIRYNSQARHVMCIFLAVTIMDLSNGPLLQWSIRYVIAPHVRHYQDDLILVSNVTDGWAGLVDNTAPAKLFSSGDLTYNCTRACTGTLQGTGVSLNCSTSTPRPLDLTSSESVNATLFSISLNRTVDLLGAPVVAFTHVFTHGSHSTCQATVEEERCTIRAATVGYDAIFADNVVRLNHTREPKSADGTYGYDSLTGVLSNVYSQAIDSGDPSCDLSWQNATTPIIESIHRPHVPDSSVELFRYALLISHRSYEED
ncbi:hypothetical protein EK21DRAFT_96560 [Setomelanomma holmii]|uniref:Transmembrane protein n=1 Tax=Setomelanomma holmii TaxID=210430 RepID=A0A9P4LUP7_9PLEO|nr:hypothetical protein EK21DRAFT_96560 [Setomelanomma holmii]